MDADKHFLTAGLLIVSSALQLQYCESENMWSENFNSAHQGSSVERMKKKFGQKRRGAFR
jgi:hypothetical protein